MEKVAIVAVILTLIKSVVGVCEKVKFSLPAGGYTGTVTFEDGNPILKDPNGIPIVAFCDDGTTPVIHIEKYFQDDFVIEDNVKDPANKKFALKSGYDIVSTISFHVKIYVSFYSYIYICQANLMFCNGRVVLLVLLPMII